MKCKSNLIVMVLVLLIVFSTCTQKKDNQQMLIDLFNNKKDITILVTDSGLGGMSVAGDIAARFPSSGVFENVKIVFFNSLFHNRSGYNSLTDEKEKLRIFNIALKAMKKKYKPDLLLIACNTLSVLYDKTPFSQTATFPVIGIVKTGVDLIADQFEKTPEKTVVIFATKTTIGANSHKKMLVERGFKADQIVGQACHRLAGRIESGVDSEDTIGLIKKYVDEALKKLEPGTPLFVSLNCTHYGYSMQQFKNIFAQKGYENIKIIDPNPKMADFLFEQKNFHKYPTTMVEIEVVSKVKISDQKKKSLDALLRSVSEPAADALQNYLYVPDLFDAKFDTTKIGK